MKFSVVIAARNEGPQIGAGLKRLRQISKSDSMEVVVVDGGSDDATAKLAGDWADRVVELGVDNRGAQWHAGARAATGDFLFFLPADAQPPGNWQQALEHFWLTMPMANPAAVSFSVDYGAGAGLRLYSAWSNARVRAGHLSLDHGLCTTPEIYRAVDGFPPVAELEDYAFGRRLAARGRLCLLKDRIHASARRVCAQGPLAYAARRVWAECAYSASRIGTAGGGASAGRPSK